MAVIARLLGVTYHSVTHHHNCTFDDMPSCHLFYYLINPSVSVSYTGAQCSVASFLLNAFWCMMAPLSYQFTLCTVMLAIL